MIIKSHYCCFCCCHHHSHHCQLCSYQSHHAVNEKLVTTYNIYWLPVPTNTVEILTINYKSTNTDQRTDQTDYSLPDDTSFAPQCSNLPGDLLCSTSNMIFSIYNILCIHSGWQKVANTEHWPWCY